MVAETIRIKDGLVLDGTGREPEILDLLITGDQITKIGRELEEKGDTIIEARGFHVSPGFIDIHTHSDLSILANPHSPEKLLQGVTTEVVGNCGIGIAPTNQEIIDMFNQIAIDIMYGEQMPPFTNLTKFQKKLSEIGHSINIAHLVPHGNVHLLVKGVDETNVTHDELSEMKALLKSNMDAGAFGMSTGLIYPPGSLTKTEELVELGRVLKPYGGFYASHIRNEATGVIKSAKEAIKIGRDAGIGVQISHLKVSFASRLTKKLLKVISEARAEGLDITADVYPYIAGSSNMGSIVLPTWVFSQGPENIKKILNDPAQRKRVINDAIDNMFKFAKINPGFKKIIPRFIIALLLKFLLKKVMVTNTKYSPDAIGKFLTDVYKEDPELQREKGIFNQTLAFLAREEGNITVCIFQESENKTLIPIMKAPFVMFGTDSLAGHPRTWGSYPKIIGEYVRDRKVLNLPNAIHKMTGMPAKRLGLKDRGLIREGYKADIAIFDLQGITANSSFDNWKEPPQGIKHVLVNGKQTIKDGKHTNEKHGRILKNESAN